MENQQVQQIAENPLQLLDKQFMERKSDFEAVLPANCTVERFARVVKTACIQSAELLQCDRGSLFMSAFKCAQDGLLPDGRDAALVVFNTKQKDGSYKKLVQYMPMVSGILKKIRNSGELTSISSHVVYDKDEFDYCLGDEEHITHKPAIGDRGEAICAYAIAKTKDGGIYREVMCLNDIEKIRSLSKNKNIWDYHWSEMARKTVIRRLSKRLPMSNEIQEVITRDNEYIDLDKNGNMETHQPTSSIDYINQQVENITDITDAPEIVEGEVTDEV